MKCVTCAGPQRTWSPIEKVGHIHEIARNHMSRVWRLLITLCKVGKHFRMDLLPAEERRGCPWEVSSLIPTSLRSDFQTVLTLSYSKKNTLCHNHTYTWVWITATEASPSHTYSIYGLFCLYSILQKYSLLWKTMQVSVSVKFKCPTN